MTPPDRPSTIIAFALGFAAIAGAAAIWLMMTAACRWIDAVGLPGGG